MPSKPMVPCKHPGCAELIPAGQKYCKKHKALHPEAVRSAPSRGYDSRWQKARKRYLRAHPLCVECLKQGRYVKATVVDHIVPHRGDPKLFWDELNWQALCKQCHDKKTGNEDSNPVYRYWDGGNRSNKRRGQICPHRKEGEANDCDNIKQQQ